jgi:hypothetical protein
MATQAWRAFRGPGGRRATQVLAKQLWCACGPPDRDGAADADTDKDVGFTALTFSPEQGAFLAVSGLHGTVWRIDQQLRYAHRMVRQVPREKGCGALVPDEHAAPGDQRVLLVGAQSVDLVDRDQAQDLPDRRVEPAQRRRGGPQEGSAESLHRSHDTYPVNLRPGIVVSDSHGTQGLYPKVYIASGKSLPAKMPDGKVIHVPYTELLNANGTPKAAKDIWNTLVKAGVPRYGELISVSDDPGEAAANYFILKLMGYPDVKVLVM